MCVQFTDSERAQMLAFKAAFDPMGLLGPSKAISHVEPLRGNAPAPAAP